MIHLLTEKLWFFGSKTIRSQELTPLFIDRYDGPRIPCALKAHDFWELTFVFRGKGVLESAQQTISLKENTAVLIPPDIPHTETTVERMDTLWVGLAGTVLTNLDPSKTHVVSHPSLAEPFRRLWLRAERQYGFIGAEIDGLTHTAFGSVLCLLAELDIPHNDYLDLSIEYMHQHFADDISISWLAATYGYCEGYYYRVFKKRTGKTPLSYITTLRIQHAIRLLHYSSLTIEQISKMSGYNDPLYFSRIFSKTTGKNPSDFRKIVRLIE